MSPDNLELVTVSVSLNDTAVICCMVYIPPNASTDQQKDLISYLTTVMASNDPILILCDFNLPDINWQTLSGNSVASDTFREFIFVTNITKLVDAPTHKHGNILDLVLIICPEHILDLFVHPLQFECVTSDHHLITFCIVFQYSAPPIIIKEAPNFKRGDYEHLTEYLLSCDCSTHSITCQIL